MTQRLTVLGSTGSIGTSTLDVVRRHPGRFEVLALSAATQVDALLAQCAEFQPRYAVMASAEQQAIEAGVGAHAAFSAAPAGVGGAGAASSSCASPL